MDKLPNEVIEEIISNFDSCKDILNFCKINSKTRESCKNNSLLLIKKAIKNKHPLLSIDKYIKDNLSNLNRKDKLIALCKILKTGDLEYKLSDFLEWAKDKITVVWCYGSLCNSDKLDRFREENDEDESIRSFLERVVDWVLEHDTNYRSEFNRDSDNEYSDNEDDEDSGSFSYDVNDYDVFSFLNYNLPSEWDRYQEMTFNIDGLIDLYTKSL